MRRKNIELPSGKQVNLQKLYSLVGKSWGLNDLRCIIVFGSAIAPKVMERRTVVSDHRLFNFKWQSKRRKKVWKEPNDIDILALYGPEDSSLNDGVYEIWDRYPWMKPEFAGTSENELAIDTVIDYEIYHSDGYSGWLEFSKRSNKFHLFRTTLEDFKKRVSEEDRISLKIYNTGKMIWYDSYKKSMPPMPMKVLK